MNLREFVSLTLQEIVLGVKDAQTQLAESGALVSPVFRGETQGTVGQPMMLGGHAVHLVEFDVAVATLVSAKGSAELTVTSGNAADAMSELQSKHDTNMSRVKFRVPLMLPGSA